MAEAFNFESWGEPTQQKEPFNYETFNEVPQVAPAKNSGGLLSKLHDVMQVPSDFNIGLAKGLGSTLYGAGELGGKAISSFMGPLGTERRIKEIKQELLTPTNLAQKAGYTAEQVGEFFVPASKVAKVGKAIETGISSAKLLQGAKLAEEAVALTPKLESEAKMLGKAGEIGADILTSFGIGAAQQGDVEGGKDAAWAAIIGHGLSETVAKGTKALADYAYRRMIPTTNLQLGKDLRRELNIGEALGKTGISFTRKQFVQKLENVIKPLGEQLGKVIDDFVAKNPSASFTIDDVIKNVEEGLTSPRIQERMKISPVDVTAAKDAVIERLSQYRNLYEDATLTLKDLQKLKIDIGPSLEATYKKILEAPQKAKVLADMDLQGKLRKIIAEKVPEAGQLNKQLAPLLEAQARILEKGPYSGYLTDIIMGGLYAGATSEIFTNPVEYMKKFATGVALKHIGTSTAAKTITGSVLNALTKLFKQPQMMQLFRELKENLSE